MTQTDTSRRRLAEETTQEIYGKFGDIKNLIQRDCAYRARDIIEAALTTLAQQIREEDARIVENILGKDKSWTQIADAIRARQEK